MVGPMSEWWKLDEPVARYQWLAGMIDKHALKRGVEIGVFYGRTFEHLMRNTSAIVHGVDVWGMPFKEGRNSGEKCYCRFCQEMRQDRSSMSIDSMEGRVRAIAAEFGDRAVVLKGPSVEMAGTFADGELDFVFIDGDHSFDGVRSDIIAWMPKLRSGGLLAGHDIEMKSVGDAVRSVIGDDFKTAGSDHVWFKWKS